MAKVIWLDELRAVKKHTKVIRKKRFYKSKLDKYHDLILKLYKEGATKAEIQRWLETKKTKVAWTTIHRWLQKHG